MIAYRLLPCSIMCPWFCCSRGHVQGQNNVLSPVLPWVLAGCNSFSFWTRSVFSEVLLTCCLRFRGHLRAFPVASPSAFMIRAGFVVVSRSLGCRVFTVIGFAQGPHCSTAYVDCLSREPHPPRSVCYGGSIPC